MRLSILVLLSAACLALPLSAGLLEGDTIQTTYLYPNTSTIYSGPVNSVVGPGLELTNFAGVVNIDFSDTNILITLTRNAGINNVAFDGLRFFDVNGAIPSFTSVTLDPSTNYAGMTQSRVTFDANTIFVNVEDLPGLKGQTISLDISAASSAPEPEGFALLGLGLAALALRRRYSH